MYVLHGGPGLDHRYFKRSLAELEQVREMYYLDFRGHGKSSKAEKTSYTLGTFTDDIEAMREELGHGSIDIFGHSMGGYVGLLYALKYSHHLETLILVGSGSTMTGITGHLAVKAKLILLNLKYYLHFRIHKTLDRDAFAKEVLLMSWPVYVPENLHKEYSEYINSLEDLKIFFDMQNELAGFNVSEDLEKINTPTLIIFGEHDPFYKNGRTLKTIRNSKFSVIPCVKHLPFLEDGTSFNIIVREFLADKYYNLYKPVHPASIHGNQ